MPCKNDQTLRCYGILHVPEISNPIISGGVAGIQYLQQTIKTLSGKKLTLRPRLVSYGPFLHKNFKHWYKRYQEYIQHFLKLIKLGVVLQHSFPAFIKLVWSTLLIIGLSIMTFLVMFWPEQNTFLKIMSCEELHSIK